ncbi:MAG TPA: hypothetical protein QF730_07135 [Planctomycetota bacterium]|jgi:hypothetical protein|nr:hypothetical protein [Planctomycetota bacterium]
MLVLTRNTGIRTDSPRGRLAPARARDGQQFLGLASRRRRNQLSPVERAPYVILHSREVGNREVLVLGAAPD